MGNLKYHEAKGAIESKISELTIYLNNFLVLNLFSYFIIHIILF